MRKRVEVEYRAKVTKAEREWALKRSKQMGFKRSA